MVPVPKPSLGAEVFGAVATIVGASMAVMLAASGTVSCAWRKGATWAQIGITDNESDKLGMYVRQDKSKARA